VASEGDRFLMSSSYCVSWCTWLACQASRGRGSSESTGLALRACRRGNVSLALPGDREMTGSTRRANRLAKGVRELHLSMNAPRLAEWCTQRALGSVHEHLDLRQFRARKVGFTRVEELRRGLLCGKHEAEFLIVAVLQCGRQPCRVLPDRRERHRPIPRLRDDTTLSHVAPNVFIRLSKPVDGVWDRAEAEERNEHLWQTSSHTPLSAWRLATDHSRSVDGICVAQLVPVFVTRPRKARHHHSTLTQHQAGGGSTCRKMEVCASTRSSGTIPVPSAHWNGTNEGSVLYTS